MDDEQLKKLHQIENDILKKVVVVCEKYHIQYYLGAGSLLGGIRHKGFIPWDDDIDILMPFSDYEKFLEIAQRELATDFFVQTNETDRYWYRAYATVQKKGTAAIGNIRYLAQQRVWVDIFPLANMGSMFEFKIKKGALMLSNYILMDHYMQINSEEFKKKLTHIGYLTFQVFYYIPHRFRLNIHKKLVHWICSGNGRKYTSEVWCAITDAYPYKCFEGKPQKVEFEDNWYNAPHDVDLYLRTQYGDNYMTSIKQVKSSDNMMFDFEHDYLEYINR